MSAKERQSCLLPVVLQRAETGGQLSEKLYGLKHLGINIDCYVMVIQQMVKVKKGGRSEKQQREDETNK